MLPTILAVRSLYSLQKPWMLMPCWPRAGPTGAAGVAFPAGSWSLTTALTRFAMLPPIEVNGQLVPARDHDPQRAVPSLDVWGAQRYAGAPSTDYRTSRNRSQPPNSRQMGPCLPKWSHLRS